MLWKTQMNFLANPITLVDPDRKGFPSLARQRGNRIWELHPVLIQILGTQMNLRRRNWCWHTQQEYCNNDSSWEYSWWPCCRRNESSVIVCIGTLGALLYMKIREGWCPTAGETAKVSLLWVWPKDQALHLFQYKTPWDVYAVSLWQGKCQLTGIK